MSSAASLFEELLKGRGFGLDDEKRRLFLEPDYTRSSYDPWLLPDMEAAVSRLEEARQTGESVVIYGDYDVDGLTATALLEDSFKSFGIKLSTFVPNRFIEGYGLSKKAIERLAADGHTLIVTVDCGSLSEVEIRRAGELGVDVIVTDHHSVAETMPPAVAVVNPKRSDHQYPFNDLAGVGVAFKLVQAMQQRLKGLEPGHEKWLLDLVALGTVCDVVTLVDENRTNVYWGLHVLRKSRRIGLRALAEETGLDLNTVTARQVAFVLGPHFNAAGRLKTAELSLELLTTEDPHRAEELAHELHLNNVERQVMQRQIYTEALAQAAEFEASPVLVLSSSDWSHGIVGIVAAKILENMHKPTFVLQEMGELTKGSARSFGDFSAVEAVKSSGDLLEKGGGHKYAAGVTLKTSNILAFRETLNHYYASLRLGDQEHYLEPKVDLDCLDLEGLDMNLIDLIAKLEPFGNGNPEPIFKVDGLKVYSSRRVGSDGQHLKTVLRDASGRRLDTIGFSLGDTLVGEGKPVSASINLMINEWQGRRQVEGRLLQILETS